MTGSAHYVSQSRAWSPEDAKELTRTVDGLCLRLKQQKKLSPTERLKEIAQSLTRFTAGLQAAGGPVIHMPRDDFPPSAQYHESLDRPVGTLSGVLRRLLDPEGLAAPGSHPSTEPAVIEQSIGQAQAGFQLAVDDLNRKLATGASVEACRDDIMRAVLTYAADLTGVDVSMLKDKLAPSLHLFDASATLAHHGQLNLAEHQRREALFEPASWQLHIPEHELSDPGRLRSCLAGLGVDIAYAMTSVLNAGVKLHALEASGLLSNQAVVQVEEEAHRAAGIELEEEFQVFAPVAAQVLDLQPEADHFVATHKDSVAAILRAGVASTPEKVTDWVWEKGYRDEVAAAARAEGFVPGTIGPMGPAQSTLEARDHQSWQSFPTAVRRALVWQAPPPSP